MYVKELIELYNVKPAGILHVGAHFAEEDEEYQSNNYDNGRGVIWVEAIPEIAEAIKNILNLRRNKVYCATVWNVNDLEMRFKVTSQTASSSLLDFGLHSETYPDIKVVENISVKTVRLDTLLDGSDYFELVVLDIQGAEDRAIESLGNRINHVKYIFMEVHKQELYKGTKLVTDMDLYLATLGFRRYFTAWDRRAKWGDALYVRTEVFHQSFSQKIRSRLKSVRRFFRQLIPLNLFPLLVYLKKLLN